MSFVLGNFTAEIPHINLDTEDLGTFTEKIIITKKTKCFITILFEDDKERRCKIYKDDDGREYIKYFMTMCDCYGTYVKYKTYADRLTRA